VSLPEPPRIVVLGNSGSGKTTLARRLAAEHGLAHLDLDSVAWQEPGQRKEIPLSVEEMLEFHRGASAGWVIEGSYADLAAAALPWCSELVFLNPGVEACIDNCRARPWEPEKYSSAEEQDARLAFLLEWVESYETRADEYGLARHRRLFDSFERNKREIASLARSERP
jgi:adenylate kinase family enzyme